MLAPRRVLLLFAVILSAPAPALAKTAPASLSGVATAYFKSLLDADLKGCLKQAITPTELQALLGRAVEKKQHEDALRTFVEKRIAEVKEAAESGDLSLKRVEIIDVMILAPESSKLKKQTVLAVVRPILESSTGEHGGFPHYMLQAGTAWRISLKP